MASKAIARGSVSIKHAVRLGSSDGDDHDRVRKKVEKLKQLEAYEDMTPEALDELAEALIDKEKLKAKFFSNLLQTGRDDPLSVKLHLSPTHYKRVGSVMQAMEGQLEIKYGTNMHTSIEIEESDNDDPEKSVMIEWFSSSLVVPHPRTTRRERFVFTHTLPHPKSSSKVSTETMSPPVQSKREQMIDKICEVIVKYNRHYEYDRIVYNCHQFVEDVMTAAGLSTDFGPELKEHLKRLKMGDFESEYEDHAKLDAYVTMLIKGEELSRPEEVPQDRLEHLQSLYKAFHRADSRENKTPNWKCKEGDKCKYPKVRAELKRRKTVPSVTSSCTS